MPPRLPGLIAFDLDGTLIDSRRDLANAANRLILEHDGVPLDERTLGSMIGDGVAALVARALAAGCGMTRTRPQHVERFGELYADGLLTTTRLYAGARATLNRLRPCVPLALLTNKPLLPTLAIVEGLGLHEAFVEVVADDGRVPRKPNPAGLLHLLDGLGVQPADCLLVGDSRVDLETARAAGTAVALARYGYGFAQLPGSLLEGDEVMLDRPEDLLEYLGF